jgi:hypothetical protein
MHNLFIKLTIYEYGLENERKEDKEITITVVSSEWNDLIDEERKEASY